MKTCRHCNMLKPFNYYHKDSSKKDGLRYICKECSAKQKSQYNKENKERHAQRNKEWVQKNPDRYKELQLRRKFGITLIQYNQMFADQGGNCLICGTNQSQLRRQLAVDHCHTTGKIRGLLCDACNTGLGSFKDDKGILTKAIKYLGDE